MIALIATVAVIALAACCYVEWDVRWGPTSWKIAMWQEDFDRKIALWGRRLEESKAYAAPYRSVNKRALIALRRK